MSEDILAGVAIPNIAVPVLTAHEVFSHFATSSKRAQLLTFLLDLDRWDRWAVDFKENTSPDVFTIQLFLQELATFVERSALALHRVPKEFVELLAHLTTTRCIYLIRYIAQKNPEFLDELTYLIEQDDGMNPDVSAIRRRIVAFSNARMLGEIFSGKRLERIVEIMRSYKDEERDA